MAIIRLQHIGVAVADFRETCRQLERLGLTPRDFRDDQGKGFQHDSRVLLGNDCWIHLVHNWNPESRVGRFLERRGEGLEHVALETDDIEADVARLRKRNVPVFEDTIFDAADGFEAFVYPDDAIGFTVELIQPHATSWSYPDRARVAPISEKLGLVRALHVGAAVPDLGKACERFELLFDLSAESQTGGGNGNVPRSARIPLGNECALRLTRDGDSAAGDEPLARRGAGSLTEIGLETQSIEKDVERLAARGIRFRDGRIFTSNEWHQALIDPEGGLGFTLRILQPQTDGSAGASDESGGVSEPG